MSALATRLNYIKPTAAEIGDVDSILRKAREVEERRRRERGLPPLAPTVRPNPGPHTNPSTEIRVLDAKPFIPPRRPVLKTFYTLSEVQQLVEKAKRNAVKEYKEKLLLREQRYKHRREQVEQDAGKIAGIIQYVATVYGVPVSEIIAKRRQEYIIFPRQVAMYLCRQYTLASFPTIADHFGGRDHSTLIHACKKISRAIKRGEYVEPTEAQIREAIGISKPTQEEAGE